MEIGVISDTHGFLDPRVFEAFENCDEIWHAGDFGSLEVANQLSEFKTLRGVYGNIDDARVRHVFPENNRFVCEGVNVLITHIAGPPCRYNTRVRTLIRKQQPDVVLCGHSHLVHVERDKSRDQMLHLNPGAAGHEGFHHVRTLIKCTITSGKLENLRLLELGPRGRTPKTEPNDLV